MRHTLDEAIGARGVPARGEPGRGFLGARESLGLAANTVHSNEKTLRQFMASVGNLQVASIGPQHVDKFFADCLARRNGAAQLNIHLSNLKGFCRWARQYRLAPMHWDPTAHRRRVKSVPKQQLQIPAAEFPRLLDATRHPRDRVTLALGMYLFTRASETAGLKVADVDLSRGEIEVVVFKTSQRDTMPICAELDDELRRWLRWYSTFGELQPDWYLVPSKRPPRVTRDPATGRAMAIDPSGIEPSPTKRFNHVALAVQRALDVCGYETFGQGGHTLRRSGARALFDRLESEGYDGAIRKVQAMLHHSSLIMTERYLGISADEQKRNKLLRGERMFPIAEDNVVSLRPAVTGAV